MNINDLKKALAGLNTNLVLVEDADQVILETRENGCVGTETASQLDIQDARETGQALAKSFPGWEWELEVVDEWVTLTARQKEDGPDYTGCKAEHVCNEIGLPSRDKVVVTRDGEVVETIKKLTYSAASKLARKINSGK